MPPRSSPQALPPAGAHSPSYFSLKVDQTTDALDSTDTRGMRNKWGTPTTAIRPIGAATSPRPAPLDSTTEFAAFRRQSDTNVFTLNHGNLSHFSMQAAESHRPSPASTTRRTRDDVDGNLLSPRTVAFAPMRPSVAPTLGSSAAGQMALRSALPTSSGTFFFEFPPNESPAPLTPLTRTPAQQPRGHHLSLSGTGVTAPLSHKDTFSTPPLRADTLPASMDRGGPTMILPQHLVELRETVPEQVLLLDLRVSPHFSKSRITGALNLCIPTTLLKRASFDVKKLAATFTGPGEQARFARWSTCRYIVVYDQGSPTMRDAGACVNTLKKFTSEGWAGQALIVKGGFSEFERMCPQHVEGQTVPVTSSWPRTGGPCLTIEPGAARIAPVAGGCPMPAKQSAANPFFGNIRQNVDLIGGVGQMAVKRPRGAERVESAKLPQWIRTASNEQDQGKTVSDRFLNIEQAELRRMQEALSCSVSYGPACVERSTVQIAGIEKGSKNRYNNIWPYDHARVKLRPESGHTCDYINASFIQTRRSNKRYIATQGPLPATYDDFWRVVWEQDVRVIVMLTAEAEGGQLKCHPYWKGRDFGPLHLKPLSEQKAGLTESSSSPVDMTPPRSPLSSPTSRRRQTIPPPDQPPGSPQSRRDSAAPHILIRKFALSHSRHPFQPKREITQLQYSSWPDFGAPAHPAHVLALVEQCDAVVRSQRSPVLKSEGGGEPDRCVGRPVLVHCSAGCGRTGTFCTIDAVIDMLKRQRSGGSKGLSQRGAVSPMEIDPTTTEASKTREHNTTVESGDQSWIHQDHTDLIAKTVEEFRDQRVSMVQSLRQYVLCYETVLEWLVRQMLSEGEGRKGGHRRSMPAGPPLMPS